VVANPAFSADQSTTGWTRDRADLVLTSAVAQHTLRSPKNVEPFNISVEPQPEQTANSRFSNANLTLRRRRFDASCNGLPARHGKHRAAGAVGKYPPRDGLWKTQIGVARRRAAVPACAR
jgi:hypothetical protein